MKGRETKGAPSADLLVCFPSRAHLTLMPPKPICSPARSSEPNKRHHNHNHHHHHHHHRLLKKSSTRKGCGAGGRASPLLWAKNKQMGSEITEPTSPKVTCAGQIKVRSKTSSCKSWQSVMEEIERIHNCRKQKKRLSWVDSLGFKKEVMQFLTCLRAIRFDFRCFGSFPQSDITTDDEDEDEDEEPQENHNYVQGNETSRTVFSKWFMVLQENQNNGLYKEESKEQESSLDHVDDQAAAVPPANALLLMRCRSAPAKSWLEEANRVEEVEEDQGDKQECRRKDEEKRKNLRSLMEEENRKAKESLVVMKYDPDFYEISSDIAQETWLVGGMKDHLSRSRSWKR
ncbi:hypothetical protein ES319_A05G236400v1 [Gossypium barbadense]|uniref:Uncharacterized protein n=2 Tax=Gossypium barbadense TaxID=3634 RepID=A0A5J5VVE1_GOSBA|nr:hypothetical protein ES319_A05G236400v1 [Gossypium barbadense]